MFGPTALSRYPTRNPFIVLRFVLFAILVYVNLLTVGFAAWNLSVLKTLGNQALGAPTFVVFNACILLTLLAIALVSAWYSIDAFDRVRNECAWTAFVSVLQLASAIDVTISGPPTLCQGVSILACASSSLTVALSWVSSTMLLLYAFSLLTTTITHMTEVPEVWTTSVRAVPWFVAPSDAVEAQLPSDEKRRYSDVFASKRTTPHFPTPIFEQHTKALPLSPKSELSPESPTTPPPWLTHLHAPLRGSSVPALDNDPDLPPPSKRTTWTSRAFSGLPSPALSHKCSAGSMRPGWAKAAGAGGRRGVAPPFAAPRAGPRPLVLPTVRPLRTMKLKSCWSASTASARSHATFSTMGSPPPPALPPKARVAGSGGGVGAGAGAPRLSGTALSPTSTFYIDLERDAVVPVGTAHRPVSYDMFPQDVVDPDMPITRSQPSTWIRAHSPASSR